MSRGGKSTETESALVVVSPWNRWGVGGEQGIVANGYEISFLGDGDVLELGCGDVCTTIVNILKTLNCML